MATILLIKEAIVSLKDRSGSSVPAINKYIETEKKQSIKKHVLKAALKRGVETGALIQVKNSYKVSADAKKEIAPKKPVSAVAKAKVKKTTSTKKTKTSSTTKKPKTVPKKTVPKKTASAPKKTVPKKAAPTKAKKTTVKKPSVKKAAPKKKEMKAKKQ